MMLGKGNENFEPRVYFGMTFSGLAKLSMLKSYRYSQLQSLPSRSMPGSISLSNECRMVNTVP
jgi:hypothetical protein